MVKGTIFFDKRTFHPGHPWLMPVILATQEGEIRRIAVQSQPLAKRKYSTQKNRAGAVPQVVECLPSKHEALSSNLSTDKKKKKK
jgi:hypothetical protein